MQDYLSEVLSLLWIPTCLSCQWNSMAYAFYTRQHTTYPDRKAKHASSTYCM